MEATNIYSKFAVATTTATAIVIVIINCIRDFIEGFNNFITVAIATCHSKPQALINYKYLGHQECLIDWFEIKIAGHEQGLLKLS